MKNCSIRSITILGGGTAGWMAAAALAKHCPHQKVRLIESKGIGTIGVGEGSTPMLKHFLNQLGVNESTWMPQCKASFKSGIFFSEWNRPGDKNDRYFHPFYSELDIKSAELFYLNANARRRGAPSQTKADDFFLTGHIAKQDKSPKAHMPLPRPQEYGYHFDATQFAETLKQFALQRGVQHIEGECDWVNLDGEKISSLTLLDGRSFHADFFIDASGFNSVLLGKSLNTPFQSFSDQLLNDRAVTYSLPSNHSSLPSYTESCALKCGWMWQIPLTNRIGNGYVYSSRFCSEQEAEIELANKLNLDPTTIQFNHLKMKVGSHKVAWKSNVLAIGLAHSFVEPIEATSLMMTQFMIESFIKNLNDSNTQHEHIDSFNTTVNRLINGIKDYIHAHYICAGRRDSPYWHAATNLDSASPVLKDVLHTWLTGDDFDACLTRHDAKLAYFRPSWYALLAGLDYRDVFYRGPNSQPAPENWEQAAQQYLSNLAEQHFSDHLTCLKNIEFA